MVLEHVSWVPVPICIIKSTESPYYIAKWKKNLVNFSSYLTPNILRFSFNLREKHTYPAEAYKSEIESVRIWKEIHILLFHILIVLILKYAFIHTCMQQANSSLLLCVVLCTPKLNVVEEGEEPNSLDNKGKSFFRAYLKCGWRRLVWTAWATTVQAHLSCLTNLGRMVWLGATLVNEIRILTSSIVVDWV